MSEVTLTNAPRGFFSWFNPGSLFGRFKGAPKRVKSLDLPTYYGTVDGMKVAAVIACVRVISQGVAQVSRSLVSRSFDAAKSQFSYSPVDATQDELHVVALREPNEVQTVFEFIEAMVARACIRGDSYAQIIRTQRRVLSLIPLPAGQVTQIYDEEGKLTYEIQIDGGQAIKLRRDEVFHLKGPQLGDLVGQDIISKASEVLELVLAAQTAQLESLRRRGRKDGVVGFTGTVSSAAAERLQDDFKTAFSQGGPGGIAVIDGNPSFHEFTQSAKDLELIEHRRFLVDEIGRYFGVNSQLLNQQTDNSSYASVEQVFIAHETNTIEPWFVRFEEAFKRDVIGWRGANENMYFKFERGALTKGTIKDIAEAINKLMLMGVYTANEARAKLGLNPLSVEGADIPMTQLNMRSGYIDKAVDGSNALGGMSGGSSNDINKVGQSQP